MLIERFHLYKFPSLRRMIPVIHYHEGYIYMIKDLWHSFVGKACNKSDG